MAGVRHVSVKKKNKKFGGDLSVKVKAVLFTIFVCTNIIAEQAMGVGPVSFAKLTRSYKIYSKAPCAKLT